MTGTRLTYGQPGVDADTANPFPVTVIGGNGGGTPGSPTPATATLVAGTDGVNLRALVTNASGDLLISGDALRVPDQDAPGAVTRQASQEVFTCSFADVGASVLSPDLRPAIVGTGVTFNQAASALNIVAGTSTNAEFLTRTLLAWKGAIRLRASIVASQRIVNNNLAIMLADLIGEGLAFSIVNTTTVDVTKTAHGFTAQQVGQSMQLGGIVGAAGVPGRYAIASIPNANTIRFTVAGWPASGSGTLTLFGYSYVRNLVTGTTATNVNWDAQRRGWATGDTVATINTTAAPGTILQNDLDGRNAYLSDTLRASVAAPNTTSRASRLENLPDATTELYVFIWSFNGTTAPATSTTWTIGFFSVENFANLPVFVQGQRAQGSQNAAPVAVVGTAAVSLATNTPVLAAGSALAGDVSAQYRPGNTGAASALQVIATASTNAAVVKASAGKVLGWQLQNTTAAIVYVKFHNQTTAPTAGSGVVRSVGIPANGKSEVTLEGGIGFATGIAITTVTGAALADATAVAANAIIGDIFFA